MKRFPILILTVFLVFSCASVQYNTGADFDSSQVNNIEKNVTTKDEIVNMFGEPQTKTLLANEDEMWLYQYTVIQSNAQSYLFTVKAQSSTHIKQLQVLFNKERVVKNYTFTDNPNASKFNIK